MAFYHFLMAFHPKQNVVVAVYGVSPLTFGVSSEINVVVAIYGVSPFIYGVSPETDVVEIIYLLRSAVYFLRLKRTTYVVKNHLLIALHQLPSAFRPKHT